MATFLVLALLLLPAPARAQLITPAEAGRQARLLADLKASIEQQTKPADKFALISGVMRAEKSADVRRQVFELAVAIPGDQREAFLIATLQHDADAGLRSAAAKLLGASGSEKCLDPLAIAAASDATTSYQVGDILGRSSARRESIFALATLANRYPLFFDAVRAKLEKLADTDDPSDRESLFDARMQALYQITHDAAYQQPFLERLKSDDPKVRERGVVAFRFLKLQQAPPELVATLNDADPDVNAWAALALGEIADPATIEPLLTIAANRQATLHARANAINALGEMRAKPAVDRLRILLADPLVSHAAAIAIYRITGEKTKEIPEGDGDE